MTSPNPADLSLEQQAGQILMPAIAGTGHDESSPAFQWAARLVRECGVGGFVLFRTSAHDAPRLTDALQKISSVPLFFAADLEAGPGVHLAGGAIFPSNMAMGRTGKPSLAHEAGRLTAFSARMAGISFVFAPVADLNSNPLNPIICTRSYGEDPQTVSSFATEFVKGCQGAGCLATAKHFPGHGDTETDSHSDLPVIRKSREQLDGIELPPFAATIKAGVRAIMTGHLAVPALDPTGAPATMSKNIITGLLRKELGFNGLVVTDALMMDAVKERWPQEEIFARAIEAGCDILLMPEDPFYAHRRIVEMVKKGRIDRRRIEESCSRVLAAKKWLAERDAVPPKDLDEQCNAFALETAREGILVDCAMKLPVRNPEKCTALLAMPDRIMDFNPFAASLKYLAPAVAVHRISPAPTEKETGNVLKEIEDAEDVIAAIYSTAAAWSDSTKVSAPLKNLLAKITERKNLTVISFGGPYIRRDMPEARNFICPYGDCPASQQAVAKIILGI